MHRAEALVELLFHLSGINHALSYLSLIERSLNALLDVLTEAGLNELRYFLTEHTVAITDGEEVSTAVFAKMRQNQV